MRIKRMAVIGVSAVCLLAMLVSIRGNSSIPVDQPSQEDPLLLTVPHQDLEMSNTVELYIDVSLDESSFIVMEALNEKFMKQHPDIKVKLRNYAGDALYEALVRAFRIGEPADIILLDNDQVLSYASKARLKPTDDFYTNEPTAEYVPAMTEQLKWNGYIWAIPYQVQPYVLTFHEQRWFDMTGVVRPVSTEDVWHVWREGGMLLDTKDPYTFAAFLSAVVGPWQFAGMDNLLGEAGEQVNDGTSSQQTADEMALDPSDSGMPEAAIESTETDSLYIPSAQSIEQDEARMATSAQHSTVQLNTADKWAMLAQGEIAAMVVPLAEYAAHQSDALAIALLPNQEGDGTALLTGRSFVLSAETKHQEAAFRWIHAMTNSLHDPNMELMTDAYPANKAAYDHPSLRTQPVYRLLVTAIEKGQALAPDPHLGDKLSIVRDALTVDASSDIWIEPTELLSQIVEKFMANGF